MLLVTPLYSYKNTVLGIFFVCVLSLSPVGMSMDGKEKAVQSQLRIHVVFNNLPYKAGLGTGWGFSCLLEGQNKTVLFDTGGNGAVLLSNMRRMQLDARKIDAVVLSHIHNDHTGGLGAFLRHNPDVTVYMPESFPASFKQEVVRLGAMIEAVSGSTKLMDGLYSTGEMGWDTKEQGLIVDTPQGLIVITGCAHPNIADMAERAETYLGRPIYLLMGGFHLGGRSEAEIRAIIQRLKALGVKKVAPSHCTGDKAIRLFREQWGEDYIEGGLGAVIELSG